jgi:Animal haem peroxidase
MENPLGTPSGHGVLERGLLDAAEKTAAPESPKGGAAPPVAVGRFGRLFPELPGATFWDGDIEDLALLMNADAEAKQTLETMVDTEENRGLPSGYTYFGQFVDHDLSLDATSLSMRQEIANQTENFRTPALDLDCLYGRGPADQPYMFDGQGKFLFDDQALKAGTKLVAYDLPRFKGRALIGDKRNDENVIVSQLHGFFMRLHNYLIASKGLTFDAARRQVQWHYQWLVLFDYLPRIVGAKLVEEILPFTKTGASQNPAPDLKLYSWKSLPFPFMPIEFAGAAYRYGHSMVRPVYRLNDNDAIGEQNKEDLRGRLMIFKPSSQGEALNGFQPVKPHMGIDWTLFFETPGRLQKDHFIGKNRIQPAYKIDTSLVNPLSKLPEFSDAMGNPKKSGESNVLAMRNIKRGMMLSLPSGQAVAEHMRKLGISDVEVLLDADLVVGKAEPGALDGAPSIDVLTQAAAEKRTSVGSPPADSGARRGSMKDSAPLWFYVLAEARAKWRKDAKKALVAAGNPTDKTKQEDVVNAIPTTLGVVGGRIVAETIIGLAWADENSFMHAPGGFTPMFGNQGASNFFERFQMGHLIAEPGLKA